MPAKKSTTSKKATSGKGRKKQKKQNFVKAYLLGAAENTRTLALNHKLGSLIVAAILVVVIGISVVGFYGEFKVQYARYAAKYLAETQYKRNVIAELTRDENIQSAKEQIITKDWNGLVVVTNANEDQISDLYIGRFAKWAKENGYDGIVFGKIQPQFEGGYKFATYSGHNIVPMKYVVENLRIAGCTNVISLMENEHKFPLPYPFQDQVNGKLKIYERNVKFASIIPTWNTEIVIEADNLKATMDHDGNIKGGITIEKPWQFSMEPKIK